MGSKNLKAIAVRGKKRIEVTNPHAFKAEVRQALNVLKRNPLTGDSLNRYGTACLVHLINKSGIFPTSIIFQMPLKFGKKRRPYELVAKDVRYVEEMQVI